MKKDPTQLRNMQQEKNYRDGLIQGYWHRFVLKILTPKKMYS